MRLEARDAFPPGLLQNPVHLLAGVVHFQDQAAIVEAFVSNACAVASLGAKEVITPRPVLDTSTATLFSPMTPRKKCDVRLAAVSYGSTGNGEAAPTTQKSALLDTDGLSLQLADEDKSTCTFLRFQHCRIG